MESLYILIPIAIVLVCVAIAIFIWAVKSEQFEDLERQGHNILFEDDKEDENTPKMTPDWLGAFLIGIIGAGHCMGMCGGIASLLSSNAPSQSVLVPIFYNLGRLISYGVIGAIVGGAISTVAEFSQVNQSLTWLRLIAALFMILLACYIGKWWHGLVYIERLGQKLWKRIAPAGQSLLPLKSPLYALPFGLVWGWLPCGLVYSTLTLGQRFQAVH